MALCHVPCAICHALPAPAIVPPVNPSAHTPDHSSPLAPQRAHPAISPRRAHPRALIAALLLASSSTLSLAQAQPPTADQPAPPNPIPAADRPDLPPSTKALAPYENRLIRAIEITGLKSYPAQGVRNQINSAAGSPFSERTVQSDVQRLNRLARFSEIDARVTPYDDGTVLLTFQLTETPIVRTARATGNRQISDEELREEINLLEGTPIDRFQIDRLVRRIKDLYRRKGYYSADVTIDEAELAERGNLIFKIREGERLKITDIRFDGNTSFEASQLRPQIKSETWGLFFTGALDDSVVDQDVAALIQFYKDRGHLDVRVDRQTRPSPDGKEAILTFIINEGPRYTLRSVRARLAKPGTRDIPSTDPPSVYSEPQIAGLMTIKAGDVYSLDKIRKSTDSINDAYGKLGYIDAVITREELRDTNSPQVDLLIIVSEGLPTKTGLVLTKGNDLTQQKVIRRQVRLLPDRPLDTTLLTRSSDALEEINIFEPGSVKLTILPPDPANPGHRDVLTEVKETNTGSLGFGAAVNSDLGVIGSIDLKQRNFDLLDTPDSFSEFFSGRAFRGANQTFNLAIQPGTNYQNYAISLSDPYIFESDYAASGSVGYRRWKYDEYSESRTYFNSSLGRSFGERWTGGLFFRAESVGINNLTSGATVDLVNVQGSNLLLGAGLRFSRIAVDNLLRPSYGTKLDFSAERIFGDFNFTRIGTSATAYIPIYEDFFSRKTVLSIRTAIGLIPENQEDVPLFERFYLGGRDFRGFAYRGVSPRGIIANTTPQLVSADPVGGTWSILNNIQIEQPLWQSTLSAVAFIDSGTVNSSRFNLSQYRVAIGTGVRVYLPQLGPAPLAFDIAVPLRREDFDDKRFFSFSIELPF